MSGLPTSALFTYKGYSQGQCLHLVTHKHNVYIWFPTSAMFYTLKLRQGHGLHMKVTHYVQRLRICFPHVQCLHGMCRATYQWLSTRTVFTWHVPCYISVTIHTYSVYMACAVLHISDYPHVQCLQPTSTVITYCYPQVHYLHIKVPFKARGCLSSRLGLLSVYNAESVVCLQDWVCCLCTTPGLLPVYNTGSVARLKH